MRLKRVEISNFKAVQRLVLPDLDDVVVVAGPNGCGKSSIFDAIRLWKSAHGGYQQNEVHQWFSEFQLGINDASLVKVMADRTKPMSIAIEVELAESERQWLTDNAEQVIRVAVWRQVAPHLGWRSYGAAALAEELRVHEPTVQATVQRDLPTLVGELKKPTHTGVFALQPDGQVGMQTDLVLSRLFSTYQPQVLGVIDYHSPQRTYHREQLGGINLNLQTTEEQRSQHALYNSQAKYSNVKSELAAAYVQDLIAQKAGALPGMGQQSLLQTLHELFAVFFPGKEFLGPQPSTRGTLDFTVRTAAGDHDIDDLSSGEKEVLYGYLRLRNTAPHNSVILLDEPELHLNPRLVAGLPDFYYKHLGKALNNQLWLVTHSDALLRQSVGHVGFKVFHMQPPSPDGGEVSQAQEITANAELEQVIIDLVGDLAAYRPGGKLVILEGGGDSEVDLRIIQDLFPDFLSRVNLISGGNKTRVQDFHGLLELARKAGALPAKVYSVTDRDFETGAPSTAAKVYRWDRFHIENYLLEPAFILQLMRDLHIKGSEGLDEKSVDEMLRKCAEDTTGALLRHSMETFANSKMVQGINTRSNPKNPRAAVALRQVIETSLSRVQSAVAEGLDITSLEALEAEERSKLGTALADGTWKNTFRGRDILKSFVDKHMEGRVGYPSFRDLIVAKMRDASFQPQGMKSVLDEIQSD
jgi:energy-coupling factor transporter ATP-binding protein EcfA2